ncbi:MAG: T9SS type A sorting domain-containing protein [Dysgonamonadaceae bacterium]|nr:T9SS type A sorting domain-containing protein [Dysgonamonadaceae bacterium]
MKKIIFFICITVFLALSNVGAQTVIIADFDTSFPVSHSIVTNAGAPASSGSTAVEAAPDRTDNALHATYGGYEQNLQLSITLPQDKALSDYESIELEIYYPTTGDNRYKDVKYSINNGTKVKVDATGGDLGKWKTLTIPLNVSGGNSFTFEIGYNAASGGNFYIDNFQLKEKGEGGGETPGISSVFEDFEDKTIGDIYDMKRWYPEDGSATVSADPANPDEKSVHITTSNWDAFLKMDIILPEEKTLADYESFSFDIYIPANSNDEYPNCKNMFVYLDDVKKYEESDYPQQAEIAAWTTKTFYFDNLSLTDLEKAKNSFALAFGLSTDKGNYYIDNFQLKEKGEGGGGETPEASSVFENFEEKTTGNVYDMKRWYPEDGSATVSVDPANPDEKSVHITTSNWDAFLKMDFVLPSEKTLADYETFSFDIYIPANSNDEYPNYKNMFVYLDDVKKYEESDYPQQAEIAAWATKTFSFDNLSLTDSEKAKNSFALAFGLSTDKGDYYIDNVKLTEKAKTGINEALSGNESFDWAKATNIQIYDLNGRLLKSNIFPTFAPAGGLYIIKAEIGGKSVVTKMFIKK